MSEKFSTQGEIQSGFQGEIHGNLQREFQGDFAGQKRREFLANSAKFTAALGAVAAFPSLLNAANSSANSNLNLANSKANSNSNSAKNSAANAQNSAANLNSNAANSTKTTTKGAKMTLTKTAQSTTTKLFGDIAKSELARTDPEFVELYANFAFDEVFAQSGKLGIQTRLKLILGALIATQGHAEFKAMLAAALKNGVSPVEVKEIIYQATAYVGFGKSADFLNACNEVFAAHKIKLPLPSQKKTARENRQAEGLAVQRKFFGAGIDKGNAAASADERHIRAFLSANCFGDYYTRGGLELAFRELLTLVILASLGGADSQVRAHIQGNLNIGHERAYLIEVFTALVPYIGYPRTLNALAALDELTLKK